MTEGNRRLRTTFDRVALLYDQVRPGYPEEVFNDIVSLSGIPPAGRILEIGCGTGQATIPLARRGYCLLCIELGENLAVVTRHKVAAYPLVKVQTGAFEDWLIEEGTFDLVLAATAFHWLDPAISYPKAACALRTGGAIALFWNLHVHSDTSSGFFEAVQQLYRRFAPELVTDDKPLPRPDEVEDKTGEIEQTGLFGKVTQSKYRWDAAYDAASYIDVLNTYSGHIDLDSSKRERLLHEIAELIDTKFNGRIIKGYLTTLYIAHRK
ncbi:MAG: class I SAM-dependent methyltransferase [Chroococcidiopsidaceae cyanobacterium CP_BM_ER_R8_30]|nr:class I SAM-dependent methyltransferase [Chroococcidiopsidaceae cyanobacterium CP_BM_ER_R8_30]